MTLCRRHRHEIKELSESEANEIQPPEISRERRRSSFDRLPTSNAEKFKIREWFVHFCRFQDFPTENSSEQPINSGVKG